MDRTAVLSRALLIGALAFPWMGWSQAEDRITVSGITGGEEVLVMLDARAQKGAKGCKTVVVTSDGDTKLGRNLLAAAGCNSEISIFSASNAFLVEKVKTWSDQPGDVHRAKLKPVIDVPVVVWVADGRAVERARDEMSNANFLFTQNRVGVRFDPEYKDVSGDPAAVDAINKGLGKSKDGSRECKVAQTVKSRYFTADTLNVYYIVSTAANGNLSGRNCALTQTPDPTPEACAAALQGNGNIIFIGSKPNLATLAHEIGHAFGLRPAPCGGHAETVKGFGADNIMQGAGSSLRSHFSLGQVYRMNTQKDKWGGTMLIKNGLRSKDSERTCPPLPLFSDGCPSILADAQGRSSGPIGSREKRRQMLEARYEALEEQALKESRFGMSSTTKADFVKRYAD